MTSPLPHVLLPLLALLSPATTPESKTIQGQVRAETGAPVAGALVLLTRLDPTLGALSYSMRRSTLTDAGGNFAFRDVPEATWLVDARDDERWLPLPLRIDLAAGPTAPLSLHLDPATAIDGVVVDDLGRPVPHARIAVGDGGLQGTEIEPVAVLALPARERVVLPRGVNYPRLPVDAVVADEQGRFRVAPLLPNAAASLRVFGVPPFHDRTWRGITGHPGRSTAVEIHLERGATIAGSVIDARGAAVPGARVGLFTVDSVQPDGEGRWLVLTRDSPRHLGATEATRQYADEAGAFLLEGLEVGRYRVAADAPGRGTVWSAIVEVRQPGEVFALTVALGPESRSP